MKKQLALFVSAPIAFLFSLPSHAALDAAVTTAIDTAETDVLALLTALTAAGVAIWVGRIIYNKFRVR